MKCVYCNSELLSKANFCPKCLRQVACLNCKETLVKDASICVYCGKTVTQNNFTNAAVNNIEFSDNGNERTFKASFTDTVAGNVVETFANLLPFQKQTYRKALVTANTTEEQTIEDIEHTEILTDKKPKSDDLATLERIFKNKDSEISLHETRLKAKNYSDFIERISLLYLYYKELLGEQEPKRVDFNNFLKRTKLKEQTFRVWLSKNRKLVDNKTTYLCMLLEGKEKAQQILAEFLDNSIPNIYELKGNTSVKNKKEETKSTVHGKSKNKINATSYQIVPSLNLKPKDKKSLTDFYSEHSVKTNYEHNLLFIYYMNKIIEEQNITINHIYTCYKEVKVKVPNNIYQSLVDTKNHKRWIETKDMNNLIVTTGGENYIEHDMVKNN
jgi:RNA polymerase subunit RPABC4/transcription elongation factor Spt4